MVDKRKGPKAKAKSIHPLDGGGNCYIDTLEKVRSYVDSKPTLTKERLKSWYAKTVGGKTSDAYVNSLFRSGLLEERDGRIKCNFPKGKRRDRGIIEVIHNHIVYVLDMLNEARDGATEKRLHRLGKRKYGLSDKSNINQIWWRRGWLESARLLERRDSKLYATDRGRRILDDCFPKTSHRRKEVNAAEFGGKGEGMNHRTLKEFVCSVAEEVCGAKVKKRKVEYPLLSGDKVDVTAWNTENVWHIEVKSCTSKDPDIERGLYQCIKYGTVGEAIEKVRSSNRKVRSLLVVESKLSEKNKVLKKQLGVCVYRLPSAMRSELRKMRRKARG